MVDNFNNNNRPLGGEMQDPNRPRLKKVKRPVNRNAGESGMNSAIPLPPKTQPSPYSNQQRNETPVSLDNNDFDLDAILDDERLPALNNNAQIIPDFEPQFIEEKDITPEKVPLAEQFMTNNMFTKRALFMASLIALVTGFFLAKIFFAEETVVRDGLQGVIINAEVPRGRARCGVAERTQGCVLYIMNPQRQELSARDFYDLASQLTGRQRFVIETGNMRYSNVKIRPGGIAQLNIPPLQ